METSALENTIQSLDQAITSLKEVAATHSETIVTITHTSTGGSMDFVYQLAVFVLAIFVGYYVVWSVTPALHTPLMAVTNAISSVIVVGALLAVGLSASGMASAFGFIALILASINIVGGFLVTQRMLAMYKKKEK